MKTISEALANIGGGGSSDDGGSPSANNSFVVTMTYDGNENFLLTADKTNAEIIDAMLSGKYVYAIFSLANGNDVFAYRYDVYLARRYQSTGEINLSFISMEPNITSASGGNVTAQVLRATSSGPTNTSYETRVGVWQFTSPSNP